jgi:hypothetical protein
MASPPVVGGERSQVTTRIGCVTGSATQGGAGGGYYADSDNGIHPRRPSSLSLSRGSVPSSHWLWASEIPFVESPVTLEQPGYTPSGRD